MTADAIYLEIFFKEADKRPMVLQYFMERPYGIMHLLKASINPNLPHPIPMRSAWIVSHLGQDHPSFLQNYYGELLDTTLQCTVDSQLRCLTKALNHLHLTDHRLGELFNFCFENAANSQRAVAVRVNCLYLLKSMTLRIPDLLPEVKNLAEIIQENSKEVSLRAAIRKILK